MASNYDDLRHPDQPTLIWGPLDKPWEQVVVDGPDWRGGFPPHPDRATYAGRYNFQGMELCSPIIIAAGPASGRKWTDFFLDMTYGGVFEKTRRTVPRISNPAPNIAIVLADTPITRETMGQTLYGSLDEKLYEVSRSMTNSFGNPSSDIEAWSQELRLQREDVGEGQFLGCSVTATTPGDNENCSVIFGEDTTDAMIVESAYDMITAAVAAVTNGAQAVEFNLACPNVTEHPEEGEMFQNPKLIKYLFTRARAILPNTPIGYKSGIYKSADQMTRALEAGGDNIDFISLINAIGTQVIGQDGNDILPGRRQTGVAGWADQTLALEHIGWATNIRERLGLHCQIIGGGGIVDLTDVDRYRNEGADIVFVAANALHNPLMAHQYRLAKAA